MDVRGPAVRFGLVLEQSDIGEIPVQSASPYCQSVEVRAKRVGCHKIRPRFLAVKEGM